MEWIKTINELPDLREHVIIYWTHPEFGDKEVGLGSRRHTNFEVITTFGSDPEILKVPYELVEKWQSLPKA